MANNQEYMRNWLGQSLDTVKSFRKGDKLVCVQSENTPFSQYEVITATKDTERGIFNDRPFITVKDPDGKPFVCHASRFTPYLGDTK